MRSTEQSVCILVKKQIKKKEDMKMGNWENNIRKVVPYTPGEQPNQTDMIKLNTNENPYPPAPGVTEVLRNTDTDALRLYPDPAAKDLVHAIAGEYGLQDDQVFVGVGSDDVLAMSFLTFFNSKKPILFPDITYSFYDVWAELFRIPYERPALDEHFHIKKEDYFRENGGIIFPNPNAPTGVSLPLSDIEDIVEHNQDVIVIVDEAYVDFGTQSALPLIEKYENLLVVQTFSKSRSMAGMRIGFALACPKLIKYGFYFEESKANFIFAAHKNCPAEKLFQALREQHIYVRYFPGGRTGNHLRITIGTRNEMEVFINFVREYLKKENLWKF